MILGNGCHAKIGPGDKFLLLKLGGSQYIYISNTVIYEYTCLIKSDSLINATNFEDKK